MAPQRKVTKEQLDILVRFLELNKDLLDKSKPHTPANTKVVQEKWLELSKKLNGLNGGAVRTRDQWRRYWTEWSSKCRKKGNNALKNKDRKFSFSNLEIRVLNLGKFPVREIIDKSSASVIMDSLKNDSDMEIKNEYSGDEIVFADDFNMEPIKDSSKNDMQSVSIDEDIIFKRLQKRKQSETPPPQWALDLEERRIASQEKMADALQSIANTLRSQEERRELLNKKMVNSLNALTGTIQDLSSGVQDVLQHIQSSKDDAAMKEVVFL